MSKITTLLIDGLLYKVVVYSLRPSGRFMARYHEENWPFGAQRGMSGYGTTEVEAKSALLSATLESRKIIGKG